MIAGYTVDQVVLVSPQLLTDIILGLDFLFDNAAAINFPDRTVSLQINEEVCTLEFLGAQGATRNGVKETALEDQAECFELRPTHPSATTQISDEQNLGQPQQLSHPLVVARDELGEVSDSGVPTNKHQGELLLYNDFRHCEGKDEDTGFPAMCQIPSQEERRRCCNTLGLVEQGQVADVIGDISCVDGKVDNLNENYDNTDCAKMCLATDCLRPTDATTSQRIKPSMNCTDDRDITAAQLRIKVSENDTLSPKQREDLYELLLKYQPHFTKRPGRCNVFEYKFEIEGEMPASANSRPIPFALRSQVRDQIQAMLRDGILEESYSAYVNPLTLVHREQKPIRICVDARRINKLMIADRVKVQPMRELLQKVSWIQLYNQLGPQQCFPTNAAE
jgi:hypothetical protein